MRRSINPYYLELLKALVCLKKKGNYILPLSLVDREEISNDLIQNGHSISLRTLNRLFGNGKDAKSSLSDYSLNGISYWLNKAYTWNEFCKEHSLPFKETIPNKKFHDLSKAWQNKISEAIDDLLREYRNSEEYFYKKKVASQQPILNINSEHLNSFLNKPDLVFRTENSKIEEGIPQKTDSIELGIESNIPIITSQTNNFDILPEKLLKSILKGNKLIIEKELDICYDSFQIEYREKGNPILLYNTISPLINIVEGMLTYKPFQIGRYHWFLSYLLINSDYSSEILKLSRIHAEKAIDIIANLNLFVNEIQNLLIKSYWLRALSYKMEGKLNLSHQLLTETISELEKERLGGYLNTLYLHRQQVLIEDKKESYNTLYNKMNEYKDDAIESYYSIKRIFEFAIISKNQKKYNELFNLSRHYYQIASPKLEQVYKFSYWKYLFIYFKYTQKQILANRIYDYLLNGSKEKQLYGQQKSLIALKEQF